MRRNISYFCAMRHFDNIFPESLKDGDHDAFRAFYVVEFDNVVYFVNKYLNDIATARDIAQDTFSTLWEQRQNIDPSYNVRTYVYMIARNKALNQLRSNTVRHAGSLKGREAVVNYGALADQSVDDKVNALQLRDIIDRIYRLLPENVRDSFILSKQMGLTYEEIARKRGVTIKVVEYEISLALKTFRKKIKKYPFVIMIALLLMDYVRGTGLG